MKVKKPVEWFITHKFFIYFMWGGAAAVLSLLLYWTRPAFMEKVDLSALDAKFKFRTKTAIKPTDEVIIIAIDEKSINKLGRWPWSRTTIAKLVEKLAPAKVTALDIVFSEPEGKKQDEALANAVAKAGNVVLGFFFREDSTQEPSPEILNDLKRSKISLIKFLDDAESVPVPEIAGLDANIPQIAEKSYGSASFNIFPDNDGIVRNSQLLFLYQGELYPSLAAGAVRKYFETEPILEIANYGVHSLAIGDRNIPVDETGGMAINYYGRGGTFKTYPVVDILSGKVGAEEIKGKVVFVGATEKGIYDLRATPVDPIFPGVEIHATVAANIIQNRHLIKDNRVIAFDIVLILVLPILLMAAIGGVNRTLISLSVFSVFLSFHGLTNYYLFSNYNVVSSMVYPAFSLGLAYLLAEGYRNIIIEGRNRYIRKAFSTYVSPSLVTQIMKDPGRLKLGGEKRKITIFFSDIRGFTSLSEKLSPEELVGILNNYLSPMTQIVLDEKGTLDKYIGDAIMVVFNAPLDIPDHAERACRMSLRMLEKLEELNKGWTEKGYSRLDIGIGINTGDAVVGNMGAELRFDYTAIGDNVNLASRLEGMNKVYGTHIIVTQTTYENVKDRFIFREIDAVAVKGKKIPVRIYELMDYRESQESGVRSQESESIKKTKAEFAKEFEGALALYKEKRFAEAKERFTAMLKKYPDDGPAKLYIERCDEYTKNPPPPDWDGAYVAKTK